MERGTTGQPATTDQSPAAQQPPAAGATGATALPAASWTVRYVAGALLIALVLSLAEGVVLVLTISDRTLRLGLGGLLLDMTLLATLIPLYRRRRFGPGDLGLRSASPAPAVGWVALAVMVISVTNIVWLHGVIGQRTSAPTGLNTSGSTFGLVLAGFFLSVCAPVTEEIFFRGVLYRALLNRMNVAWAALIAGTVFALVHGLSYPLDTLPPRLVFGVIACLLYERTGSLLPGIALHCLIDASGFDQVVSGNDHLVFNLFLLLGLILLVYAGVRAAARHTRATRARPS